MSAISGFCEKCNKFRKRHCDGNRNTCMSILFDTIEALQQEINLLIMEITELRESNQALKDYAENADTDKDEQVGWITKLEKVAKDLYFAYINKDPDFPHSFETQATERYKALLGGKENGK